MPEILRITEDSRLFFVLKVLYSTVYFLIPRNTVSYSLMSSRLLRKYAVFPEHLKRIFHPRSIQNVPNILFFEYECSTLQNPGTDIFRYPIEACIVCIIRFTCYKIEIPVPVTGSSTIQRMFLLQGDYL